MKDENKIKAELIKESKTLRKEREKSALDDTTKHKQLEEKYQSFTKDILDASKVGIFILNSDFKVVWINNALENYFGLQREKIIGKDKRQLIKENIQHIFEDPDEFIRKVFATYDNNIYIENFECHVLPKGKRKERWLEHWSQPIKSGLYAGERIEYYYDITERKQAEEKLRESHQKLKKTMNATIETMSRIIEAKDPYTAGHQQRVSQLATAIAKELNLSPDKVEGIRVTSLIHDIGKISVPTEILSKSTKLTDIEFSLIKGHSQIGYDILKSIDFSYPIAQIVLQHHERLNGSGYPNKLKGDEILLEAKIIGVADVVEAMSSHRPYRPALGIDVALEEISQNRGILYDPEVVDACLKLFKEKGFKFEIVAT